MRGLTAAEREVLATRAANGPRQLYYQDSPYYTAHVSLRAAGRMTATVVADPSSITGDVARHEITDLGRLALRVCPVGEP